jgi:GNAT superfamily N-acetyltransferase
VWDWQSIPPREIREVAVDPEATVRAARVGDIPTLAQHRKLMFEDMRTSQAFPCKDPDLDKMEKQYEDYLGHQMTQGFLQARVAEVDGNIVGSGCVSILAWPPAPGCDAFAVGLLHSMYTVPQHRKQGIGLSIINALVAACKAKGCRQIVIGGRGTNAGHHLYETIGFSPAENMHLNL